MRGPVVFAWKKASPLADDEKDVQQVGGFFMSVAWVREGGAVAARLRALGHLSP